MSMIGNLTIFGGLVFFKILTGEHLETTWRDIRVGMLTRASGPWVSSPGTMLPRCAILVSMEHDASYKLLFSHARMVEDLLPARLPGVDDRETLHTLLRQAITCPTLAAFWEVLGRQG